MSPKFSKACDKIGLKRFVSCFDVVDTLKRVGNKNFHSLFLMRAQNSSMTLYEKPQNILVLIQRHTSNYNRIVTCL